MAYRQVKQQAYDKRSQLMSRDGTPMHPGTLNGSLCVLNVFIFSPFLNTIFKILEIKITCQVFFCKIPIPLWDGSLAVSLQV